MRRAASRLWVGAITNSGCSPTTSTRCVLRHYMQCRHRLRVSHCFSRNGTARAWQSWQLVNKALSTAAEPACATASARQLPASTSGRVLDTVLLALRRHSCAPANNLAGPQLKEFRRQMVARWQTLEDRLVMASNSLWTTGAGQVRFRRHLLLMVSTLATEAPVGGHPHGAGGAIHLAAPSHSVSCSRARQCPRIHT